MAARVVLHRASRARWLARRRKGITATDAAVILGHGRWRTPLEVWLEKVQPVEDTPPTYQTERGHALERTLATEYARQTGAIIDTPPLLVAHPDHPRILASLDWLAHTPDRSTVLECKTDFGPGGWADWADDDLPDAYAVQALVQAACTGLPVIVFADVGGQLETREIQPDPEWEAEAIPVLLRWWDDHVTAGQPPSLDPYRDYVHLNRVWRTDPGTEVDADPRVLELVARRRHVAALAAQAGRDDMRLKTAIRAHMGTHQHLVHPDTGRRLASLTRSGSLRFATQKGTP